LPPERSFGLAAAFPRDFFFLADVFLVAICLAFLCPGLTPVVDWRRNATGIIAGPPVRETSRTEVVADAFFLC
jgi:hypothetical protein